VLSAPLSREAGGEGACAVEREGKPAGFADTSDPDYAAMLAAIKEGRAQMLAKPRVDMPGGKPEPYYREFDRVFQGFAGP
jgi:hypothetical protein